MLWDEVFKTRSFLRYAFISLQVMCTILRYPFMNDLMGWTFVFFCLLEYWRRLIGMKFDAVWSRVIRWPKLLSRGMVASFVHPVPSQQVSKNQGIGFQF